MVVGEATEVAAAAATAAVVADERLVATLALVRDEGRLVPVALGEERHDGHLGAPAPQAAVRVVGGDAAAARAAHVLPLGSQVPVPVTQEVWIEDGGRGGGGELLGGGGGRVVLRRERRTSSHSQQVVMFWHIR